MFTQSRSFITASQAAGLIQLNQMASLRGWGGTVAGIGVRTSILLCGATGVGKSALLRLWAAGVGDPMQGKIKRQPLLEIGVSNWIVRGSGTKPLTSDVIRDFVRGNDRGVLFLDEIDKIVAVRNSGWDQSLQVELLGILDGSDRLASMGWTKADCAKLRGKFTIVGAGAWQSVAIERRSHPIGFGGGNVARGSYGEMVAGSWGIPEEVSLRFNPKLIYLEVVADDISRGIKAIRAELELSRLRRPKLDALVAAAMSAGTGMRWLESYLTDLIIKQEASRPPFEIAPNTEVPISPAKDLYDLEEIINNSPRDEAKMLHDLRKLLRIVPPFAIRLEKRIRLSETALLDAVDVTHKTSGTPEEQNEAPGTADALAGLSQAAFSLYHARTRTTKRLEEHRVLKFSKVIVRDLSHLVEERYDLCEKLGILDLAIDVQGYAIEIRELFKKLAPTPEKND